MQILYKNYHSSRRFGVEIEVNRSIPKQDIISTIQANSNICVRGLGHVASVNNRMWHVKTDETCGDDELGGWEIASFVGRNHQDILHVGEIASTIGKRGAKVNSNCGLHVHVEAADFTPWQVGVLLSYWIKIESVLLCTIPDSRAFWWCQPLTWILSKKLGRYSDDYYSPMQIYNAFLPVKKKEFWDFRYRAVNITNYVECQRNKKFKRATIEFRLPESSLDEQDVINWTRMFVNFVDYVKNKPMPSLLNHAMPDMSLALQLLGLNHENDNFYIFSPGLTETRKWLINKVLHTHHCISVRGEKRMQKTLKINAKKLLANMKVR